MFFPGRWSHLVSLALLAQHTKRQKTMTQYLYIHDKNTTQANTTQAQHKHKIKHKTNLSAAQTQMFCGSQQEVVGVSNTSEGLSWKNDGFDDGDYDY
jgi:hypothetical protein